MLGLLLGMYIGEPCRICGETIKPEDLLNKYDNGAVWAGYSACGVSRAAHKACWNQHKDNTVAWVYSESAPIGSKN